MLKKTYLLLFFVTLLLFTSAKSYAADVTNVTDDPNNSVPGSFRDAFATGNISFALPDTQNFYTITLNGDLRSPSNVVVNNPPQNYVVRVDSNGHLLFSPNHVFGIGATYIGQNVTGTTLTTKTPIKFSQILTDADNTNMNAIKLINTLSTGSNIDVDIENVTIELSTASTRAKRYTGGGLVYTNAPNLVSGKIKNLVLYARSSIGATEVIGGGIYTQNIANIDLEMDNVGIVADEYNGTYASSAVAMGGGIRVMNTITGKVTGSYSNLYAISNLGTNNTTGKAQAAGGALYIFNGGAASINANMSSNKAEIKLNGAGYDMAYHSLGGAIFAMNNLTFEGGSFLNNAAIATGQNRFLMARGGAVYLDASTNPSSGEPLVLTLKNNNTDLLFQDNYYEEQGVKTPNDIHIGQEYYETPPNTGKNVNVNINGNAGTSSNSISVLSGIDVNLNNGKTLTFNREILAGETANTFNWNRVNTFTTSNNVLNPDGSIASTTTGAETILNFKSGSTHLYSLFQLTTSTTTPKISLLFGKDHGLSISVRGRAHDYAFFDLTKAQDRVFTVEKGTKILAPIQSNAPIVGEYLLVDNSGPVDLSLFDVEQIPNFKVQLFQKNNNNQLWIRQLYVTPATYHGKANVKRAIDSGALMQIVDPNNVINTALFDDIESIPPEAAITSLVINKQTHIKAMDLAKNKHHQSLTATNAIDSFNATLNARQNKSKAANLVSSNFMRDELMKTTDFENSNKPLHERRNLAALFQATAMNMNLSSSNLALNDGLNSAMSPWTVWASYFGSNSEQMSHKAYSGYKTNTNGMIAGLSYSSNSWKHSVFSGYSYSDERFKISARNKVDSFHAGLLSTYSLYDFDFTIDGAYSHSENRLKRDPGKLENSKSKYGQDFYSAGLEVRYHIPIEFIKTSIFASGHQIWSNQDAFKESGGPARSKLDKTSEGGAISEVGLNLSKAFEIDETLTITPFTNVSWKHDYSKRQFDTNAHFIAKGISSNTYLLRSAEEEPDAIVAGAGFNFAITPKDSSTIINLETSYNYEGTGIKSDHTVYGGFSINF